MVNWVLVLKEGTFLRVVIAFNWKAVVANCNRPILWSALESGIDTAWATEVLVCGLLPQRATSATMDGLLCHCPCPFRILSQTRYSFCIGIFYALPPWARCFPWTLGTTSSSAFRSLITPFRLRGRDQREQESNWGRRSLNVPMSFGLLSRPRELSPDLKSCCFAPLLCTPFTDLLLLVSNRSITCALTTWLAGRGGPA